jgi:hypothetical protein
MIVPVAGVNIAADNILAWMEPHGITLWGTKALLVLSGLGSVGTYGWYVLNDIAKIISRGGRENDAPANAA